MSPPPSTVSSPSQQAQRDSEYDSSSESQGCRSGSPGDDDDGSNDSDENGTATAKNALEVTGKKRKRREDQDGSIHGEESIAVAPVLSHAERRRQRRRELQKRQDDLDAAVPIRDRKPGAAADTSSQSVTDIPKKQNSVWVGNLSYKTTAEDLKSFFAWAGDITRIHMPVKTPAGPGRNPENRGFAYVDFSTSKSKAAAIALSEQPLIGRRLLIKDGDDFTGRPGPAGMGDLGHGDAMSSNRFKTAQKILRAQKQPPGPTLFLGNLGFETTEAAITEMLSAHRNAPNRKQVGSGADKKGENSTEAPGTDLWIRKVRMGTFEDSGLCKGFAFVDFVNPQEATSVLINPKNYFLNGRKLVIEYASADAVRRGMPKAKPIMKGKPRGRKPVTTSRGNEESREPPTKRSRTDNTSGVSTQEEDKRIMRSHKAFKSRAKPGAVLASAQRESTAIIPSEGKKIKFD